LLALLVLENMASNHGMVVAAAATVVLPPQPPPLLAVAVEGKVVVPELICIHVR
jgi:hypothetical protein